MNHCARYIPGGHDCANQIGKIGHCALKEGGECSGKIGGAGANLQRAEDLLAEASGDKQQQGQTEPEPRQME